MTVAAGVVCWTSVHIELWVTMSFVIG